MSAPASKEFSADQIATLQRERLQQLLDRVRTASGSFYRPADRLDDLPVLTADAFVDEVAAHPPFGRLQLFQSPLQRTGLATAGLPRPTPIVWTRDDIRTDATLGARALRRAGLEARSRTSDCIDGGLVAPGTLAVGDALDALDALALPVGPITAETALQKAREVWKIIQPEMLIVDAATHDFLSEDPDSASRVPRTVLLTPDQTSALAAPPTGDVFRILSLPQITTFAAGECTQHTGLHLSADAILAEIGADERLLVSTLVRGFAVLRFDTGLRARIDPKPCACGDPSARLQLLG